jgi:hypothetical protein
MYRKAMPRSSKILDEKWQQHLREMHHKRMKTIRPEIDNKAPPRFVHLAQACASNFFPHSFMPFFLQVVIF